jgi:hypothetical protein
MDVFISAAKDTNLRSLCNERGTVSVKKLGQDGSIHLLAQSMWRYSTADELGAGMGRNPKPALVTNLALFVVSQAVLRGGLLASAASSGIIGAASEECHACAWAGGGHVLYESASCQVEICFCFSGFWGPQAQSIPFAQARLPARR